MLIANEAPLHLIVLLVIGGGALALWISAVVSISRQAMTATARAVWFLIVLIAPFLGPILWFLAGKPSVRGPFQS